MAKTNAQAPSNVVKPEAFKAFVSHYTLDHFQQDNAKAAHVGDQGEKLRDMSEGFFARNILMACEASLIIADGRKITLDMLGGVGAMIAGAKNAEKDNDKLAELRNATIKLGVPNPNEGTASKDLTDVQRKRDRDYRATIAKMRRAFDAAALLAYANIPASFFIMPGNKAEKGYWQVPCTYLVKKGEKVSDAKYTDDSLAKLDNSDSMLVSYRTSKGQPANKIVRFSFAALKDAQREATGTGRGGLSLDKCLRFIVTNIKPEQYAGIAGNDEMAELALRVQPIIIGLCKTIAEKRKDIVDKVNKPADDQKKSA